ncbi:MAG: hypothetical protein HOM85_04265 [Euryarchaeota archaeon]|nr:hypothetical protein [Euryarchaeota archaeon]
MNVIVTTLHIYIRRIRKQCRNMGLVLIFIIAHGFSGKLGGFKNWLSKQNSIVWGIICGVLITATFLLRPAETVEFIYFRF